MNYSLTKGFYDGYSAGYNASSINNTINQTIEIILDNCVDYLCEDIELDFDCTDEVTNFATRVSCTKMIYNKPDFYPYN